jgi:hypothetical protein
VLLLTLAFVGGFADAGSYLLSRSFTGHRTGHFDQRLLPCAAVREEANSPRTLEQLHLMKIIRAWKVSFCLWFEALSWKSRC